MLVLSRRIGEQICIGNGVVVTVVSAKGNRILLGIEAPPDVSVDRQEVRQRKDAVGGARFGELAVAVPR